MKHRRLAAVLVGFVAGAACSEGVQWSYAKPKDVPDYLMPFYLTTLRRRFNHYARSDKEGKKHMTSDDFIRSLLCAKKPTQEVAPAVSLVLDELFRTVDSNNDGLLSFSEFSLFMLFLCNPKQKFELAFKMFDRNESGTVDVEEFKNICRALSNDPTVRFNFKGGITRVFFGDKYDQTLTLMEFWRFVTDLRRAVWRAEFNQFDPNMTGSIRPEDFATLVTDSMLGAHLPFYIVDNMRKIKNGKIRAGITFEAWETFNQLMINSPNIGRAIQTYTAAGKPLNKEDFVRAVQVAAPGMLFDRLGPEVDLIFAIFDRDGDGHLEYDEFLSVARSKYLFNAKHNKDTEESPPAFQLFSKCLSRSWDQVMTAA